MKELTRERGIVHFQGRPVGAEELRQSLIQVDREVLELRERVERHDQACRTVHLAIVREQDKAWAAYLQNLASILHYAAHSRRYLEHLATELHESIESFVAEGRRLGQFDVEAIDHKSQPLQKLLEEIWEQRQGLQLTPAMREKLLGPAFTRATTFENAWTLALPPRLRRQAAKDGFPSWLGNLDRSVAWVAGALEALEGASLDLLLEAELEVRRAFESETTLGPAPPLCAIQVKYSLLGHDHESERARWWARPTTRTDPVFPVVKTAAAALILLGLLGLTAAPTEAFALRDQLTLPGT